MYLDEIKNGVSSVPYSDIASDAIISGFTTSTSATLTSTILSGVAYILGNRISTKDVIKTFTASVDTYIDLDPNRNLIYTEVANGATAPSITVPNLRISKVVTDIGTISSVTDMRVINAFASKIDPVFIGSITEQVAVSNLAIDATNGTVQTYTAAANFTFTDVLADGQYLTLVLVNGGFTPTYPTITWWEGVEPILGTTDKLYFEKIGATLYGSQIASIV